MRECKSIYWNAEREAMLAEARTLHPEWSDSRILHEALKLALKRWQRQA